jgi:geranylgeranyl diphosphate synthase type 3
MLNLHRGQGHDIHTRDSSTVPTESQYISMVIDKTGGLFRLAVGLMQAFATTHQSTDFVPLVNNLGLYFQIRDDLINLADEEYFKSKSFCEDLTEGKFSYPIIHCIRMGEDGVLNSQEGDFVKSSRGNQLLSILKQRTEDVDVKRYAQRLMFEAGSLQYTREKCTMLKREIVSQIEELGGNEPLLKVLEMLDVQVEKIAEVHDGEEKLGVVGTPAGKDYRLKNLDYT